MTTQNNTNITLGCFFCGKTIETAKEVIRSDFYMNACDECYEKEHDSPIFNDSDLEYSSE